MSVLEQIDAYIASQPTPKCDELRELHRIVLDLSPEAKLWFLDGKDDKGKIVSNPNIGYGFQTIKYANGTTRDFYRVGMSANQTGISIYFIGIKDKKYLPITYGNKLGKASITGYCIKFKTLKDIHIAVLKDAIKSGLTAHTIEE